MSQGPENFESLRRLLALKRHEQPPPRYFNDFSSQVIARIKLGESGESGLILDRLIWEAPWLQRIWAFFEAKPILSGAFGVAVCGLLISGVIYSDRTDVPPIGLIPVTERASGPVEVAGVSPADHPLLAKPATLEASSTNPVGMADDPFFGGLGKLQAQRINFSLPGRN